MTAFAEQAQPVYGIIVIIIIMKLLIRLGNDNLPKQSERHLAARIIASGIKTRMYQSLADIAREPRPEHLR